MVDNRPVVQGIVVRAEFGGVPMRRQSVSVRSQLTGRSLRQGRTKNRYDLAYGLQTGDGEIPLRGAQVGDAVDVVGPAPGGGILVGSTTITRNDPHTLVVALSRFDFPFVLDLAAHSPGALDVVVRSTIAPPPDIVVGSMADPAGGHVRLPSTVAATVGGLPRNGAAVVAVTIPDGDGVVAEHDVALHVVDESPATCRSSDGALKLRLPADTFGEPRQLVITSLGGDFPGDTPLGEIVAGPYRIMTAPDNRWERSATLVFRMSTSDLPEHDPDGWITGLAVAEFDTLARDWRDHTSAYGTEVPFVSTRIDRAGLYALVQRR